MTKKLKHFIKGVGSVVDLAPPPRASRFIPRDSDSERLRGDFERIGIDMKRVLEMQRNDGKATHPKKQLSATAGARLGQTGISRSPSVLRFGPGRGSAAIDMLYGAWLTGRVAL